MDLKVNEISRQDIWEVLELSCAEYCTDLNQTDQPVDSEGKRLCKCPSDKYLNLMADGVYWYLQTLRDSEGLVKVAPEVF